MARTYKGSYYMKKTFKVKNILNNKKKYNFKTELLALAALVLLTPSLSTSCKKDNVNPVKTEEPVDNEKLKKERLDRLENSINLIIKESYDDKSTPIGLGNSIVGLMNRNNSVIVLDEFIAKVSGTPFKWKEGVSEKDKKELIEYYDGIENLSKSLGYLYSVKKIKEVNSTGKIKLTPKGEELLKKLKDSCEMYVSIARPTNSKSR